MNPPPIALVHLPRTGGHSLWKMIKPRFGARALRVKAAAHVQPEVIAAISPRVEIIGGHMNYGLHEHLPVRYATVLREPIERTLSNFRFWESMRLARGLDAPFEGQPQDGGAAYLDRAQANNVQTRMLAGVLHVKPRVSDEAALALAKRHLEGFFVVGFYDDLDGFIRRLGLEGELPRLNNRGPPYVPTPGQLERLRNLNLADLELYAWAKARFGG